MTVKNSWWNKREIDLLAPGHKWLIQIAYWTFHFSILTFLFKLGDGHTWESTFIWLLETGGFVLVIFYSYFYYFVPRYLGKSNWKFLGIILLTIITYPLLKLGIDMVLGIDSLPSVQLGLGEDLTEEKNIYYTQELLRRLMTVIWNVPFALFARFMIDWFKNRRIKSKMETQQLQSELSMLRNQVNPHFLFNVLNNIDAMVYPHSEEASEAIMKLSAIMRYMLYESNADFVSIKKEVDYLKAYIELQRMRLKESDQVIIKLEDSYADKKIAPMILIPFIENAFKHAARLDNQLRIEIFLSFNEDLLQFKISNSHELNSIENKDYVGGIGLNNVTKRLQLIYHQRHELNIKEAEDTYTVELQINL